MTMSEFLDYWADLGWREFRVHACIYSVVALLFVIVGPFETGGEAFLFRLVYWFSSLSVFGGLILPIVARMLRVSGWIELTPLIPGAIITLCLAAIPMTVVIFGSDVLFLSLLKVAYSFSLISLAELEGLIDSEPYDLAAALLLYVQVLVIVVINIGLVSVVVMQRRDGPVLEQSLSVRPGAAFFSRLPDRLGTNLLYMQMEDHYLRVVTKAGEDLVLVRLRDAMNELEGLGGLQVHRSWWVVSSEIEKLSRTGRRTELIMSDSARVPVSNSFRKAVDELLRNGPSDAQPN